MSVSEVTDVEEVPSEIENAAEQLGLHPDYEPVLMDPVEGYSPLVDAWVSMLYPLNVSKRYDGHGVIECGNWQHARQYPDGSGVYQSGFGQGVLAIRTSDRVVVWNNFRGDPWPYDCEAQNQVAAEFEVPFRFVGEVLTRQTDLNLHGEDSIIARGLQDGENFVDGVLWMQGVTRVDVLEEHEEEGALLEHKDGSQVYIGRDSTAHDSTMFGFVPFDGTQGIPVPSAADALDLLRPDEALATEQRQGEWFFVDASETHSEAKGTIQKPGVGSRPFGGSPLENHVPRDWKTRCHDMEFVRRVAQEVAGVESAAEFNEKGISILDLPVAWQDHPQDIFDKIHEGEVDLSLERARELADGIYVRGTVRHRGSEHRMTNLEDWHQPMTHDYEVITLDPQTRSYHVD